MANSTNRATVQACAYRIAELDSTTGAPLVGADHMVECEDLISVQLAFSIKDGTVIDQANGCDETCIHYVAASTLNGLTVTMPICDLNAEVFQMAAGGQRVRSGGDTIGYFAIPIGDVPGPTSLEFWTKRLNANGTDADTTLPWWHWGVPKLLWRIGDMTLENGVTTPALVGTAYENANFADGPGHEFPIGEDGNYMQGLWGYFAADDFPADPTCAWATTVAS